MAATSVVSHASEQLKFIPPRITLKDSARHWLSATPAKFISIEHELLSSYISFFPESCVDSKDKRSAKILDVPVNENKEYIHELFIENDSSLSYDDPKAKHIVVVHGFGASLGFFFKNFEQFSKIKNVKLHFIDMFGFGLSSRAKFPAFNTKSSKLEDLQMVESFFIDAFESWRINRNLDGEFVLIAHSLGGYLSFAYSLKYPTHIKKLILVSPVGVERSSYSSQYNLSKSKIEIEVENEFDKHHIQNSDLQKSSNMAKEFVRDLPPVSADSSSEEIEPLPQEDKLEHPESQSHHIHHKHSENHDLDTLQTNNKIVDDLEVGEQPKNPGNVSKLVKYIWEHHLFTPMTIIRFSGPFGSKLIYGWSERRFSNSLHTDREFLLLHKYVYYSVVSARKSGECCITRLLAPGTVAYFPLLDKIPGTLDEFNTNDYYKLHYLKGKRGEKNILKNIPTFWIYGDRDWMNRDAGKSISDKINELHQGRFKNDYNNSNVNGQQQEFSKFKIVEDAGHHVYLDNPKEFYNEVINFIEDWLDNH